MQNVSDGATLVSLADGDVSDGVRIYSYSSSSTTDYKIELLGGSDGVAHSVALMPFEYALGH